jgi:DNA-binding winged helix-turn-helix (wHTH) protein
MGSNKERLELCVTYVARDITLGVKRSSVEFVERLAGQAERAITVEGHLKLESGVSFYVNTNEFCLGRSVNNDLFVDSPKISRSHAKIIAGPDASYELRDLSSANGTSVSGHRLTSNEAYKLRDTGEIQLAGVFHLKFADYGATYVAPDSKTIYGITLSYADRRISLQGAADEDIRLSNSEYRFLQLLMDAYPETVSHRDLAFAIWGWEPTNADDDKRVRDALFNIVKRLRERLEMLDPDHEYIETLRKWGDREGGYRFNKQ